MQPKLFVCWIFYAVCCCGFFSKRPYNRFVFLRPAGGVYETRLFSIFKSILLNNNNNKCQVFTCSLLIGKEIDDQTVSHRIHHFLLLLQLPVGFFGGRWERNKQRAQIRNSFYIFKLNLNWISIELFFHFIIRLWRVVGKFAGFNIGHTRGTNTARQFYCTFGGRRLYSTEVRYQSR